MKSLPSRICIYSTNLSGTKGQIKSERIYEVIGFPNYQLKNLKDFCSKSLFEAYQKIVCTNNFEYTWQK